MILLNALNLSIGYDHPIQRNLEVSLNSGDILFLSGLNGSGKSTLIKTLLGEIAPIAGNIESKHKLNNKVLPQNVVHDLPLSITFGEMLRAFNINAHKLDFLQKEFLLKKWSQTSGGEKQKALILTRIGKECDILFLDEPFNHIDKKEISALTTFLKILLETKKVRALVIISHIRPELNMFPSVKF